MMMMSVMSYVSTVNSRRVLSVIMINLDVQSTCDPLKWSMVQKFILSLSWMQLYSTRNYLTTLCPAHY